MIDLNKDIEAEARRLDERIKKLQEEKALLYEQLEAEKQRLDLARKVGLIIVSEFQDKPFEYKDFQALLDTHLADDFDRAFFGLQVLSADDPRRPKKRGRRKREFEPTI
jgi:hypothetical protein